MTPLLDRRLLFVTGKGGVGKTTVASALALLAARQGKRTLACEFDSKGNLADFFSVGPTGFDPTEVQPEPARHVHGHRGVAQGVPQAPAEGSGPGQDRPAGPDVRLRGQRRAGGQGDRDRRQGGVRGPAGALRPGGGRRLGHRSRGGPAGRSAGHRRAGEGGAGQRPDAVDDRHPRRSGPHGRRDRRLARGDARVREHRAGRADPRGDAGRVGRGGRQPGAARAVRAGRGGGLRGAAGRRDDAAAERGGRTGPSGRCSMRPSWRSNGGGTGPGTSNDSGPRSRTCRSCTCPSCSCAPTGSGPRPRWPMRSRPSCDGRRSRPGR